MNHIIQNPLKCSQCGDVDNYETRIRPYPSGQWHTKLTCLGCGHVYEPPTVVSTDHTETIVYQYNPNHMKEF